MHHELLTKEPNANWISILTPYSIETCTKLKTLIGGLHRPRDIYYAIASFAGHSSPAITLSTYLHFTDLVLAESLKCINIPFDKHKGNHIFGLSRYSAHKVIPSVYANHHALQPLLFKRLKSWCTTSKPNSYYITSSISVKEKTDYHYMASQQILAKIEQGIEPVDIAAFYNVSSWEQTAIALRALKTKENQSRLFPQSRLLQLLPTQLNSEVEKQEINKLRSQCKQLILDKTITIRALCERIKYLLLNVNSSRSGIRFDDPARFKLFMPLMLKLFSVRR